MIKILNLACISTSNMFAKKIWHMHVVCRYIIHIFAQFHILLTIFKSSLDWTFCYFIYGVSFVGSVCLFRAMILNLNTLLKGQCRKSFDCLFLHQIAFPGTLLWLIFLSNIHGDIQTWNCLRGIRFTGESIKRSPV